MADGTNNTERKAPVTHKDVTITFMLEGIDAVGVMLANHTDAVAVLEKSMEALKSKNQDATELETLRDKFLAAKGEPGVRGRKPAKIGDKRAFSVQQVVDKQTNERGEVFIRLPLGTLGAQKGDKVAVRFLDGETIVALLNDETDDDVLNADD